MTRIQRSALVPFSARTMFSVVDDVPQYPLFLPWCAAAEVLESTPTEMVASLEVASRGVRERFTTRNRRYPHERIELVLVDGPFRMFEGAWNFTPIGGEQGCRVELALTFELSGASALLGPAFSTVFVRAADRMVDAFCARARALAPRSPHG